MLPRHLTLNPPKKTLVKRWPAGGIQNLPTFICLCLDQALFETCQGKFGSFATTAKVTDGVSSRANVLEQTDARDDIALDAYAFTRNAYYQSRKNQIFNGMPPEEDFFDLLDESYDESHASLEAFNETSVMDHEAQSARAVN